MTPKSFDPETARHMVGDERARNIEARARADADNGKPEVLEQLNPLTYWAQVQHAFERVVYDTQYQRRVQRNQRKANPCNPKQ